MADDPDQLAAYPGQDPATPIGGGMGGGGADDLASPGPYPGLGRPPSATPLPPLVAKTRAAAAAAVETLAAEGSAYSVFLPATEH